MLLFLYAQGWVRTWLGDVLVVLFMVSTLAALGLGRPWQRLLAVGLISAGTEAFQGLGLISPQEHWLLQATVGSTFDPLDLLAYLLGLGVSAVAERAWAGPPGAGDASAAG